MQGLLYPAAYALFVWWFSTGVIVLLDNLPRRTFRWSFGAGTALFAVSLYRLHAGAGDASETGAFAAFTYALIAWGWQEMSFFMGVVTGPRRVGAAPDAALRTRFCQGFAASVWHELAILATAALIVAATWGAPNQVGTWTFLLLWLMRTSAKLNVVLGVRNLGEEFLPAHLHYLLSFMARRPMNGLMPLSLTAGTVGTALLAQAALAAISPAQAAGLTFLATMLALAVVEHWFLILPLPFSRLWAWALRAKRARTVPVRTRVASSLNEHVQPDRALGGSSHGLPALLP